MPLIQDPEGAETHIIHDLVNFEGKDILEIGCGDGRLTWRFAEKAASVFAIDPKEDEIAQAIAATPEYLKTIVTFVATDVTTLPLPADSYDVAVFTWSL